MTASLRFPASKILAAARRTYKVARPFADQLATLGSGPTLFAKFEVEIAAAEETPTHGQSTLTVRGRTITKDNALEECVDWAAKLRHRRDNAVEDGHAELPAFPSAKLRKAESSETAMGALMAELLAFASTHAAALAECGQTEQDLTDGATLRKALGTADTAQETAKVTSTSETETRKKRFLVLYRRVNRINRDGRRVFKDDPEKRVLFKSPWPKPGKNGDETPPADAADNGTADDEEEEDKDIEVDLD